MSQDTNIVAEIPGVKEQHESRESNPPAEYRWVKCVGCGGEIGVPRTWEGDTADCPRCGIQVRVKGWLQYRPPNQPVQLQAVTPSVHSISPGQPMPSVELQRKADGGMTFGIVCVFFGWTVLVPLFSLCHYCEVSSMAKKEGIPVPLRATIGLILTLIFGGMQTLALVVKLNH